MSKELHDITCAVCATDNQVDCMPAGEAHCSKAQTGREGGCYLQQPRGSVWQAPQRLQPAEESVGELRAFPAILGNCSYLEGKSGLGHGKVQHESHKCIWYVAYVCCMPGNTARRLLLPVLLPAVRGCTQPSQPALS